MNSNTDWNILIQSYLSLIWCQKSIAPENQNKKVSELLQEFKSEYEGINPFNIGSMLSAVYICFMYPQQKEFNDLDFGKISTNKFKITNGRSGDSKYICRRVRNSLAHSRFDLKDDLFIFKDRQPNGNDEFEAQIKIEHFGDFLNKFFFECKKQFFKRKY